MSHPSRNGQEQPRVSDFNDETHTLERLRRTLDSYQEGETGVAYGPLIRFAEPLYALYELDPDTCIDFDACDPDALAATAAVLETARLLWAYCTLDRKAKHRHKAALAERLLGPNPARSDFDDLETLLAEIEAHWRTFSAKEIALAETVSGYPVLSFEDLIETPEEEPTYTAPLEVATGERFGPQQLELPDALALFARPMMESPDVLRSPDALEAVLTRASSYWDLATASSEEYPRVLARIVRAYGKSPAEAALIEQEARRMVARFHELFPEQRKAHA